jgi:energy-coupling factor transport system permease/ATP-binding protein
LDRARAGAVDVRGLTWRPSSRRRPVLRDLDLSVAPGERVLLAGPSGGGKSTLLRAIAGLLLTADTGDLTGEVLVGGAPPAQSPGRVGLLLQDPAAAVVAERVGRDVAFGPENLRVPRSEIWPRVHRALASVEFPYGTEHLTSALSGGESQRLALAGALALAPEVLLLDEPTSMLDPVAAAEVRAAVLALAERRGCTTVVVDHRIEPWVAHVDRLVVLDAEGRFVADGVPAAVLAQHREALAEQGVWVPGLPDPEPGAIPPELVRPHRDPPGEDHPLVRAERVVVSRRPRLLARGATTTLALDGVDADLRAGSVLAVTGPSGSGKSTLLAVLAGLHRPDGGEVRSATDLATRHGAAPWAWRSADLAQRLAWVPQRAEHGIVTHTVEDEVLAASRALRRPDGEARRRAWALLEALGLSALAEASPHHLSGGEQRRLMVAAAFAHGPSAVLLDEPTVGQDRHTWAAVIGACHAAAAAGAGAAMATHDTSAVRAVSDRELILQAGRVQ